MRAKALLSEKLSHADHAKSCAIESRTGKMVTAGLSLDGAQHRKARMYEQMMFPSTNVTRKSHQWCLQFDIAL